jgi:hypothetical protein
MRLGDTSLERQASQEREKELGSEGGSGSRVSQVKKDGKNMSQRKQHVQRP